MNPTDPNIAAATTDEENFRVVDLYSPSEERPSATGTPHVPPPRVGGRMPSSFVFANPLFAPAPAREVRPNE